MKSPWSLLVSVACTAALLLPAVAAAEPFDTRLRANVYRTNLVQAADECAAPTTLIGGVAACAAANVNSSEARFSVGRLLVRGIDRPTQVVAILGSRPNEVSSRDLAGRNLRVQLTLRLTKRSDFASDAATWADQVLTCGTITVPTSGRFVFRGRLVGASPNCGLTPSLASETFMKEVVSAAVIDADTGLPLAVPGVRRR